MLEILLLIFVTLTCAAVMMWASQAGLLRSITFCFALSITFALVLAFVLALPTPLIALAALLFAALLAWLGKVEHTDPNAATDHQQEQTNVAG